MNPIAVEWNGMRDRVAEYRTVEGRMQRRTRVLGDVTAPWSSWVDIGPRPQIESARCSR